jgi:hypothetical protein
MIPLVAIISIFSQICQKRGHLGRAAAALFLQDQFFLGFEKKEKKAKSRPKEAAQRPL